MCCALSCAATGIATLDQPLDVLQPIQPPTRIFAGTRMHVTAAHIAVKGGEADAQALGRLAGADVVAGSGRGLHADILTQ